MAIHEAKQGPIGARFDPLSLLEQQAIADCAPVELDRALQRLDQRVRSEQRVDGQPRWWRFFPAGVQAPDGRTAWQLYNDYWRQDRPEGWRLYVWRPDFGAQVQQRPIATIIRTDISAQVVGREVQPNGSTVPPVASGYSTVQFGFRDGGPAMALVFSEEGRPVLCQYDEAAGTMRPLEARPVSVVAHLGTTAMQEQYAPGEQPAVA